MTAADAALYVTIVAGISNVALAGLTTAYVILTRQMVRQMKAAREPSVFVDIESSGEEVRLVIGNSSDSPALNLRFAINENIPWREDDVRKGFQSIDVVRDGLPFLAPRRVLKFYVGSVDWDGIEAGKGLADVNVTFENEVRDRFNRRYPLDIATYAEVTVDSFGDPLSSVAKALRDAERSRSSERLMQTVSRHVFFSRPPTKNCPSCGKAIPEVARKCPECLEYIDHSTLEPQHEPQDQQSESPENDGDAK
jgi:hypothetical protein